MAVAFTAAIFELEALVVMLDFVALLLGLVASFSFLDDTAGPLSSLSDTEVRLRFWLELPAAMACVGRRV